MKSQRRHELETNDLAKRLARWGERVQPYSTAITVTVVAVAAGVLIAVFVSSRMAASRRAAWDEFTYVMTSAGSDWDRLRDAAEEHPGTDMSELARVTWADAELRKGTSLFFRDQPAAQTHLENAREVYQRLIEEADDPAIVNRARLGMARVLETEGDPGEAIKFYRAVEGPFAEFARTRAEDLSDGKAQESITWLANAEMPDVEPAEGPGTPGARPPFGSDFSLDPSIPSRLPSSMPAAGGGAVPATPVPDQGQAGQQQPGAGNQPFEIQNPFAGPSDPDRYAEPPADGAEGAGAAEEATDPAPPGDEGQPPQDAGSAVSDGEQE